MILFWIDHFFHHIPNVLKLITSQIIVMLVIIFFHYINKKFQSYRRFGFIAFILSIIFPGSGFAYARAYVRAWLTYGIMMINYYFIAMHPMTGNTAATFFYRHDYSNYLVDHLCRSANRSISF